MEERFVSVKCPQFSMDVLLLDMLLTPANTCRDIKEVLHILREGKE